MKFDRCDNNYLQGNANLNFKKIRFFVKISDFLDI